MRYIITTFQGLGIALVATATLRLPDVSGVGTLIGLWLIVFGFVLHMLIGGDMTATILYIIIGVVMTCAGIAAYIAYRKGWLK